jgi:hypothetical protein
MTVSGDVVGEADVRAPPHRRRAVVIGAALVVALALTAIVSFR